MACGHVNLNNKHDKQKGPLHSGLHHIILQVRMTEKQGSQDTEMTESRLREMQLFH